MTRTELFTREMVGISGASSSLFLHQAALSLLDRCIFRSMIATYSDA
ncbi:MAG: hypothetical protein ACYDBP_12625 [Leptospirales bacterium]